MEDLKNVSHVTRLKYSILQKKITLGGHTSFSILVGALVLCLECCKKDSLLQMFDLDHLDGPA